MTRQEREEPAEVAFAHFESMMPAMMPHAQRVEMRKAFYCGFGACLAYTTEVADLPEDQACASLDSAVEHIARTIKTMGPPKPDADLAERERLIPIQTAQKCLTALAEGVVAAAQVIREAPDHEVIETVTFGWPAVHLDALSGTLARCLSALNHVR